MNMNIIMVLQQVILLSSFFFTLTAELHTSIIKEPLVTFYKTPHGYLYTSNKV